MRFTNTLRCASGELQGDTGTPPGEGHVKFLAPQPATVKAAVRVFVPRGKLSFQKDNCAPSPKRLWQR